MKMYGFSSERMKKSIKAVPNAYNRASSDSYELIRGKEHLIRESFRKLDSIYPRAIFPRYFIFSYRIMLAVALTLQLDY